MILDSINSPSDLQALSLVECEQLAAEMRDFIVEAVTRTGGHLGSNLGVVELTLALHRVFNSPTRRPPVRHRTPGIRPQARDRAPRWIRAPQATRAASRDIRPGPSPRHDRIENSHASTALSYAHGIATALRLQGADDPAHGGRHVVAVVGDGALTGGMAYEALNNLGHSGTRVLIVLNDNGRSYAPTVSRLSGSLTQLRLDPRYMHVRETRAPDGARAPDGSRVARLHLDPWPHLGRAGGRRAARVLRGTRHSLHRTDRRPRHRRARAGDAPGGDLATGPIVLHVPSQPRERATRRPRPTTWPACTTSRLKVARTRAVSADMPWLRGRRCRSRAAGGASADDPGALPGPIGAGESYTEAFSRALVEVAAADERIVAITAAMPGPTGLLAFQDRYPERFIDVGIAEQHALTAAAGMAMNGLRPVVAIYSTFLARAVDQWNLDVGLHGMPVVICADRAGITGDDGPSHHGIYDLVQALSDSRVRGVLPRRAGRDRPDARRSAQARRSRPDQIPEDAVAGPARRAGDRPQGTAAPPGDRRGGPRRHRQDGPVHAGRCRGSSPTTASRPTYTTPASSAPRTPTCWRQSRKPGSS